MKMNTTTRKLLLGTAALLAGVGVASAQGMHDAGGAAAGIGGGAQGMHERGGAQEHGGGAVGMHNGGARAGAGAGERSHGNAAAQLGGHGANRATVGAGGQAETHANARGAANARERGIAGQASREQNAQRNGRHDEHAQGNANARENGTVGRGSREENAQRNAQQHQRQMGRQAGTSGHTTNGQAADEQNGQANMQNRPAGKGPNQAGAQAGANARQNGGNRVQLTSQQRTHIRESVLSHRNVPRVDHVDFALHTGAVVPDSVHYVSISDYPTLVEAFPAYRDDYFVVAEDQIVVLNRGRRVVDVVPLNGSASGRVAASGGAVHGAGARGAELSSADVRQVQQVLVDHGYDIEVDGNWGPATRDALVTFQRREGLPATGMITTQTVARLGLRGNIAGSRIEGGASTTGQGEVRENGRMGIEGNRSNVQQGQHRSNSQNANAPENNRATTGQAGNRDNENQRNAQGSNRPQQHQSANGQGGGRNRSTNGLGADTRIHSTTGQGGGQIGANAGEQPRGGNAPSNAPSQGNMPQSRNPQK